MKKLVFMLLIVAVYGEFTFSQTAPKFNLTKDGVAPVVLTFDASYSAYQLYTKVKSWNATMAKYPASAIRVDKEGAQVKFGGHIVEAWKIRDNNYDHWYTMEYTMNIESKDGRCRVTFETPETRYKVWFNTDGTTVKKFKDSELSFETTINNLLSSLYNHIKSMPKKAEDNW